MPGGGWGQGEGDPGDKGGEREGGTALDLGLMCKDSRLDTSQSPSLVSEQGSRSTVPDLSGGGRGCSCRSRGRALSPSPSYRGRYRGRGMDCGSFRSFRGWPPGAWVASLTPGLPTPPPGSLVGMSKECHSDGHV